MAFDLSDYIDVASRVAEFREKHPDGCLQTVDLQFLEFGGGSWVVYRAAAYRTPDDPRPGHGTAWEPVPGKTPYTKDSELQNAETAAWGRAMVAVLAADTKRGVASADEVRTRQDVPDGPDLNDPSVIRSAIARAGAAKGMSPSEIGTDFTTWSQGRSIATTPPKVLREYLETLS